MKITLQIEREIHTQSLEQKDKYQGFKKTKHIPLNLD